MPLSDYALLGDGTTAALVARDGAVDWMCHGRLDGPAVFCRLLDADRGGHLSVAPVGEFAVTRSYVEDTNVLVTDFECAQGRLRLTDVMPLGRDEGPMLLRRLQGLAGSVEVLVEFVPTFDFARAPVTFESAEGGATARAAGAVLRLGCAGGLVQREGALGARLRVASGQTHWLALTHGAAPPTAEEAEGALRSTLEAWERWSARGRYFGPYRKLLRRSALALKQLIHGATGAMVAAPTSSLPESPGGMRNWDYRFTWLRDASWIVSALMAFGYHDESMRFIDWLEGLPLADGRPPVFLDLDGRPPRDEQELNHLRGYRGARPVRLGNAASGQDQHDVFGEVVAAIFLCSEGMPSMRPLRPGLWNLVRTLADGAVEHWAHEDHGLWEQRAPRQHYLSSKLLCWAALDRALAIGARDGLSGPVERWQVERARIRRAVLAQGYDPEEGAFTRVLGEPALDSTALLVPRYGLLPADDPRMRSTVARIRERLGAGSGLLYRYTVPDGMPGREGTFVACSFWLVDCLAREGRLDEGHRIFEAVIARTSDLGLLSEEVAPDSGELLGNYPQALSHLALIRAAHALEQAEAVRAGRRPEDEGARSPPA